MTQPPQLNSAQLRHAQELERVTVPITLSLEQSLHLRGNVLSCTCVRCFEFADFITDEISRALLASDAPSAALAVAEQRTEHDRLTIRRGLATHYFIIHMKQWIQTPEQFDRISRLAVQLIPSIDDTSGTLAEFRQRIEELAASHLAVLDVDQHG